MKKLIYLFFTLPLFLVACIRPPVPDVEQAIQDADPNTVVLLSNEATGAYFRTALPFAPSPTRGLIYSGIQNRADIEQVERSMIRLATDFFNPETHLFREGQQLTRDFVINLLAPYNSETHPVGLNPPFGSSHTFDNTTVESVENNAVRPLAYILEQNFVTPGNQNDFHLEGVAISLALNPYYRKVDPDLFFEIDLRMTDEEIITIGQEIAEALLPQLRGQEGLEEVPILLGLFILQSDREVIPGRFASISYIEEGRSSIQGWQSVQEQHFRLPDVNINAYDVNINDEFRAFRDTVDNYFPHQHSFVGRVHIVKERVYHVDIVVNMSFLGYSEKIAFHQLLEDEVMNFSDQYDIRITVRSPDMIHGVVTRPPGGEVFVHKISW